MWQLGVGKSILMGTLLMLTIITGVKENFISAVQDLCRRVIDRLQSSSNAQICSDAFEDHHSPISMSVCQHLY